MVAPFTGGGTLIAAGLTRDSTDRRHRAGARISVQPADQPVPPGTDVLFLIGANGTLRPAAPLPVPPRGSTLVLLGPAPAAAR